jgi:hypothetical protein
MQSLRLWRSLYAVARVNKMIGLALIASLAAQPVAQADQISRQSPPKTHAVVHDFTLSIPAGYLIAYSPPDQSGAGAVLFEAMLPDFRPANIMPHGREESIAYFRSSIGIYLDYNPSKTPAKSIQLWVTSNKPSHGERRPIGLLGCLKAYRPTPTEEDRIHHYESAFTDEFIPSDRCRTGADDHIFCLNESDPDIATGLKRKENLQCTDYRIYRNTFEKLYFERGNLLEWERVTLAADRFLDEMLGGVSSGK